MTQKNLYTRNIGLLVVLMLCISMIPTSPVLATNESETKTYIVVTASEESYENAMQLIGDDVAYENETLKETNMLVGELTDGEVKRLEKQDGVLFVEEDISIEANSSSQGNGNQPSPVANPSPTASLAPSPASAPLVEDPAMETFPDMKNSEADPFWENMQAYLERNSVSPEDYEWNMKAISANDIAQEVPENEQKIKVAILDSGVDIVRGINLAVTINLLPDEQKITPMFWDMTGHGTAIASIIAGNPQNEVQGVNPNAELYSVKVLDGSNKAPVSRIIEGIYW